MAQAQIKKSKGGTVVNSYDLSLKKLTKGELMALTRALLYYDSPVSGDVLAYIRNALYELKDDDLSATIELGLGELTAKLTAKIIAK